MKEMVRMDERIAWRALTSRSTTLRLINIVFVLYLLVGSMNALSAESQIKINDAGEYNHKSYEDRDEATVICGDFRVIAFSDYKVRGTPPRQSQDVIRQYFEFTDLKNGDKKMLVATTMTALNGYSESFLKSSDESKKQFFLEDSYLNGKAYAWACLKGKDAYYLAILYGTGGNCDNCVWIEIMNRKGEVVVRSIKDIDTDNHSQYKKKLSELGLPQLFPAGKIGWDFKQNIKFRKVWLNK